VHRQALDNPIVQVATNVRQGEAVPIGQLNDEFIRIPKKPQLVSAIVDRFIDKYYVKKDGTGTFLCARNKTRKLFNRRTREKLGYNDKDQLRPQVGEIVVCLRNNKTSGLKNGTLCMVTEECTCTPSILAPDDSHGSMQVMNLQTNQVCDVTCWLPTFYGEVNWEQAKADKYLHFFDYGYALTVHKSQGSEWDAVILFADRMASQTKKQYQKWLYTGITRASKKLVWVG
jgi:ATP-dependent exoDNAse (exonuclease V) alpha subunit